MTSKKVFVFERGKSQQALLLLCFVLLLLPDTSYSGLLPGGSKLRFAVIPLLLLAWSLWAKSESGGIRNRFGLNCFTWLLIAGILSSLYSVAPALGFLKLGLFVGLVVPLFVPEWSGGGLQRQFRFGPFPIGILLILGVAAFPGIKIFGNPNQLGAFVLVAMPFVFGWTSNWNRSGQGLKILAISGVLLSSYLLVISGSRGSLLGAFAAGLTFIALKKATSKTSAVGGAFLVVVLGFVGAFLSDLDESERLEKLVNKDGGALIDEVRMNMYKESMANIRERPLLGYGFGLSWRVRPEHISKALKTGRLSWFVGEFGNSTLAILSGGGLLLLFAYYGLIWAVIIAAANRLFLLKFTDPDRIALSALIAGVVGLLIQGQAEGWMLSMTWQTMALWMFLGALNNLSGRGVSAR